MTTFKISVNTTGAVLFDIATIGLEPFGLLHWVPCLFRSFSPQGRKKIHR